MKSLRKLTILPYIATKIKLKPFESKVCTNLKMRLDNICKTFYGPSETKLKGIEAFQATGNLIVQLSQDAFSNVLHFYEKKTIFTTAK